MSASVVDAFCFTNPLIRAALHLACAPFVLELTRLGLKMESMIARDGHLKGASQWLLKLAADSVQIQGSERIPRSGPLLFVANHAGLGDAHALLMSSPRTDTRVLAHDFGILPGLRQTRRHVILIDPTRPQAALRESLRHLRAGRSLLLYPRGAIEADPCLDLDAALASLPHWSRSIELFARHVPELAIVPVAAGGFLSRRALRNPIVLRYQDRPKREFLAATFQLLFPVYRDPRIRLAYAEALRGECATRAKALASMAALLPQISLRDCDA